jgi:hypothetical protein
MFEQLRKEWNKYAKDDYKIQPGTKQYDALKDQCRERNAIT